MQFCAQDFVTLYKSPDGPAAWHAERSALAAASLCESGRLRLQLRGESMLPTLWPGDVVEIASCSVDDVHPGEIVLGADTTVVIDDQIVGKPNDHEHARQMLSSLSGKWHEVLTGVAIVSGETQTGIECTRVKFADMTDDEIAYLALLGDPLDKAGAYAVQAQAALFIEGIEGDYWNVVGLPVRLVYELVMKKSSVADPLPAASLK